MIGTIWGAVLAAQMAQLEQKRRDDLYAAYLAQRSGLGGQTMTRVEFDLHLDNAASLRRIADAKTESRTLFF